MNALIEASRQELTQLCRCYAVRRLELFGSATRGGFDRETSDLDFLVDFHDMQPAAYADAYFGLLEALTRLFQRPVDLVTIGSVKNPYFLQGTADTRTVLYAA